MWTVTQRRARRSEIFRQYARSTKQEILDAFPAGTINYRMGDYRRGLPKFDLLDHLASALIQREEREAQ